MGRLVAKRIKQEVRLEPIHVGYGQIIVEVAAFPVRQDVLTKPNHAVIGNGVVAWPDPHEVVHPGSRCHEMHEVGVSICHMSVAIFGVRVDVGLIKEVLAIGCGMLTQDFPMQQRVRLWPNTKEMCNSQAICLAQKGLTEIG